jgi:sigma-E factor negative regulatory protein RseA
MERISALMDGELGDQEAAAEVTGIKQDPELRLTWETYHLIGETLRGEAGGAAQGFVERFSARLAEEPTVLAPRRTLASRFNVRVALPIAASLAGVAVVAALTFFNNPFQPNPAKEQVVMRTAPAAAIAAASQVDEEYLLAHQQFSTRAAMQGVASYIRTVQASAPNQ